MHSQGSNRPHRRSSSHSGSRSRSQSDQRSDHRSDQRSDHQSDHRSDQRSDQRSDHRSDQRSDQRSSHGRSSSSHRHKGSSSHHRHRHRPGGVAHIQEVVTHASRRLSNHSVFGMFLLAFFGGGLLTIGAFFGITLASTATSTAMQTMLLTIGIATGLFIAVGLNAILFTEPNVIMPSNLYNTSVGQGFGRLFKFWVVAWFGNFFGALAFAWIIKLSTSYSPHSITFLQTFVSDRLLQTATGSTMGFFETFFSGMLGNWVLGFALIYAVYNRAAVGKLFILMFTVGLVVATNLQFFPINLAYFSILSTSAAVSSSWFEIIVNNLVPVSIGNLVGGAFFVALPLLFQTHRARAR